MFLEIYSKKKIRHVSDICIYYFPQILVEHLYASGVLDNNNMKEQYRQLYILNRLQIEPTMLVRAVGWLRRDNGIHRGSVLATQLSGSSLFQVSQALQRDRKSLIFWHLLQEVSLPTSSTSLPVYSLLSFHQEG